MPTAMNTYYVKDMTLDILNHLMQGHLVYLQWKCVKCGDKITADDDIKVVLDPNNGEPCVALHKMYRHDDRDDGTICGGLTPLESKSFNYMVAIGLPSA